MTADSGSSRKRGRMPRPVEAGAVLDRALERLGLQPALARHQIVRLWPKIVSSAIAAHSKAEKLTGSVLHILVDSSAWMNELSANKAVILRRVNSNLPQGAAPITDLRFRQSSSISRVSTPPPPQEDAPQVLSEADRKKHQVILDPVKDSQLRALLGRILEKDGKLKNKRRDKDNAE
jgi:hypothetical protein